MTIVGEDSLPFILDFDLPFTDGINDLGSLSVNSGSGSFAGVFHMVQVGTISVSATYDSVTGSITLETSKLSLLITGISFTTVRFI